VAKKKKTAAPQVSGTVKNARTPTRKEKVKAARQSMREGAKSNQGWESEIPSATGGQPQQKQPWQDTTGSGTGAPGGGGGGNVNPPVPQPTDSLAFKTLQNYLMWSGFPPDMTDFVMGKINDGTLPEDAGMEDYIGVSVEHPSFQARFPVIVEQFKKRSAGDMSVQIMTPMEVIDYEKQVRNTADDYGLSGWVSSPEQISTLILNNVDVEEAKERINLAGYAAMGAPKAFRDAFIGQHGLSEGNLVGFFLDPDKEEEEIRKQVTLGKVMGAAISNGFGNDWRIANRLYDRGYVPQGAAMDSMMSEFARAALSSGLSSGLGETVSADERIDAAFNDPNAMRKVASVAAQRSGRFNTSGGAVESQRGVSGLGASAAT
jgi:hypothetical protein